MNSAALCHACQETFFIHARDDNSPLRCRVCGSDFVELLDESFNGGAASHSFRSPSFAERTDASTVPLFSAGDTEVSIRLAPSGTEDLVRELTRVLELEPIISPTRRMTGRNFASEFERLVGQLAQYHQPSGSPASSDVVRNLRRQKLDKGNSDLMEENCVVCHDTYKVGETVMHLPCKHIFHEDCVTPWLNSHNTCPVCRHAMPTESEQSNSRSRRSNQSYGGVSPFDREVLFEEQMHHSLIDAFRGPDGVYRMFRGPFPSYDTNERGPGGVRRESPFATRQGLGMLDEMVADHNASQNRYQLRMDRIHDSRRGFTERVASFQNRALERERMESMNKQTKTIKELIDGLELAETSPNHVETFCCLVGKLLQSSFVHQEAFTLSMRGLSRLIEGDAAACGCPFYKLVPVITRFLLTVSLPDRVTLILRFLRQISKRWPECLAKNWVAVKDLLVSAVAVQKIDRTFGIALELWTSMVCFVYKIWISATHTIHCDLKVFAKHSLTQDDSDSIKSDLFKSHLKSNQICSLCKKVFGVKKDVMVGLQRSLTRFVLVLSDKRVDLIPSLLLDLYMDGFPDILFDYGLHAVNAGSPGRLSMTNQLLRSLIGENHGDDSEHFHRLEERSLASSQKTEADLFWYMNCRIYFRVFEDSRPLNDFSWALSPQVLDSVVHMTQSSILETGGTSVHSFCNTWRIVSHFYSSLIRIAHELSDDKVQEDVELLKIALRNRGVVDSAIKAASKSLRLINRCRPNLNPLEDRFAADIENVLGLQCCLSDIIALLVGMVHHNTVLAADIGVPTMSWTVDALRQLSIGRFEYIDCFLLQSQIVKQLLSLLIEVLQERLKGIEDSPPVSDEEEVLLLVVETFGKSSIIRDAFLPDLITLLKLCVAGLHVVRKISRIKVNASLERLIVNSMQSIHSLKERIQPQVFDYSQRLETSKLAEFEELVSLSEQMYL